LLTAAVAVVNWLV